MNNMAKLENENERLKKMVRWHAKVFRKLDEQVGGLAYNYPQGDKAELRELFEFDELIKECQEFEEKE